MSGIILHLGLGAFHRAHQAFYTERANQQAKTDWKIESVSMRNPSLAHQLNQQKGRYHLLIRAPDGPEFENISCMGKAYALSETPSDVVSRFRDTELKLVTITVTEKGYTSTAAGEPLWDSPVVAHDLEHPETPQGLLGVLVEGLAHRKHSGAGPISILSCDNLPNNGALTRRAVLAFAKRRDVSLAEWIDANCSFPSSMVDRITPASSDDTFATIAKITGENDPMAVETEPFTQWVIEDNFVAARPEWELAGAQIVSDVRPFEEAKLRMLNGAHSLIAYMGSLLGYEAVRDVMATPILAEMVHRHMRSVAQSLEPIAELDFEAYARDLIQRFENPAILHRCLQIASDGSQKLPQRIFSPAFDLIQKGKDASSCAYATACWLRFIEGQSENTQPLPLNDPMADALREAANKHSQQIAQYLDAVAALFKETDAALWANAQWRALVSQHYQNIKANGVIGALD